MQAPMTKKIRICGEEDVYKRQDYVEDFTNVMERFGTFDPQLVILDIGLPFFNGFYWCQQIRQVSQVPIIFLSSLDDNMNIVMAMNMGCLLYTSCP